MNPHFNFAALLIAALFTIGACKKDDDVPVTPTDPPNEEEVITTAILTLIDTVGAVDDTSRLIFRDVDGEGGNAPEITSDTLTNGHHYLGFIRLLNEAGDPVEDITEEVEEEATVHQFFFEVTGAALTWTYADTDVNGKPIGLRTSWDAPAGPASSGSLKVTLRHEPDKNAPGVSDGDITNAGGETDLEVTFPVAIRD
jgi:hypothetical protein